jgi:hypothetical protein
MTRPSVSSPPDDYSDPPDDHSSLPPAADAFPDYYSDGPALLTDEITTSEFPDALYNLSRGGDAFEYDEDPRPVRGSPPPRPHASVRFAVEHADPAEIKRAPTDSRSVRSERSKVNSVNLYRKLSQGQKGKAHLLLQEQILDAEMRDLKLEPNDIDAQTHTSFEERARELYRDMKEKSCQHISLAARMAERQKLQEVAVRRDVRELELMPKSELREVIQKLIDQLDELDEEYENIVAQNKQLKKQKGQLRPASSRSPAKRRYGRGESSSAMSSQQGDSDAAVAFGRGTSARYDEEVYDD